MTASHQSSSMSRALDAFRSMITPVLAMSGNLGSSSVTAISLSCLAVSMPSRRSICARSGVPGGLTYVSESRYRTYSYFGSTARRATSFSHALCLYIFSAGTCNTAILTSMT